MQLTQFPSVRAVASNLPSSSSVVASASSHSSAPAPVSRLQHMHAHRDTYVHAHKIHTSKWALPTRMNVQAVHKKHKIICGSSDQTVFVMHYIEGITTAISAVLLSSPKIILLPLSPYRTRLKHPWRVRVTHHWWLRSSRRPRVRFRTLQASTPSCGHHTDRTNPTNPTYPTNPT
jgi:hypothetical protein